MELPSPAYGSRGFGDERLANSGPEPKSSSLSPSLLRSSTDSRAYNARHEAAGCATVSTFFLRSSCAPIGRTKSTGHWETSRPSWSGEEVRIEDFDVAVAAHAVALDATLVTDNVATSSGSEGYGSRTGANHPLGRRTFLASVGQPGFDLFEVRRRRSSFTETKRLLSEDYSDLKPCLQKHLAPGQNSYGPASLS